MRPEPPTARQGRDRHTRYRGSEVKVQIISGCPRCGSLFLHAATAARCAICGPCGYVIILGSKERLADDIPADAVTTISSREDLPDGYRIATRITPTQVCETIVAPRAE